MSDARTRYRAWPSALAPGYVAACATAISVGAVTGRHLAATGRLASMGLSWIVVGPAVLAMVLVVRGLFAAWRPATFTAALRDEHGAWPRLAAWVMTLWLAVVGLGWGMFQAIWRVNLWTQFKPLVLSFAAPIAGVVLAGLGVVLAAPVANLLARGFAWLDARWRGRGWPTLMRPWPIALVAVAALAGIIALAARFVVRERMASVPSDALTVPGVVIAVPMIVHAAWSLLPRGARAGTIAVATVAIAAVLGVAVHVVRSRPVLALAIWAEQPIARIAVEKLRPVEAIRTDIPRAQYRPKLATVGAPHPDILLVTVGDVRADETPPYAGPAEMPVLRELVQRGAVFSWAYAPSSEATHALVDMMVGRDEGHVRGDDQLDPRHVLLADRLRAGGYETVAFACCGTAGPAARVGLQRGLDHVTLATDGARLVDDAKEWLRARDARGVTTPLFVWVHLDLPPLGRPAEGADRDAERRRLYDHALGGVDASIRNVIDGFSNRPPARAPVIAIVGDRGYSLGDHGIDGHGAEAYNGEVRVPWLLIGPGVLVQQVQETVSTVDLTPTLLELAGFAPPAGELDGQSLATLARGQRASTLPTGDAFIATSRVTALVRGNWKLIDRGSSTELYDIKADPFEHSDQSTRRAKLVETMRSALTAHTVSLRASPFK